MEELLGSIRMITNSNVFIYMIKGLGFTLVIALVAVIMGIIFGTLFALSRNYCNRGPAVILKWFSIAYIEVFRNTPLMLWLFVGIVFFPSIETSVSFASAFGLSRTEMAVLFKAIIALVLFTSSVIAEIVRGGLNSIDKGQFEAAYSQGFSMAGALLLIVLPQTFRNIVPTLLSQIITTIKDTSYIANIALAELLGRTFMLIRSATLYTGLPTQNMSDVFILCGLACIFYFIINFTLSIVVRRIQPKYTH